MQHCCGKIPGSSERQVVEIYSVASEKAFECLAAKICDIGMSSRPFDSKDRANHPGLEDLTKPASEHVIGLDGIAIVVNPLNTIRKLTLSQVKRIFCKTPQPVDTWGELGITGLGQIRRVVRNDGSGTREMFIKQVCQGADLRDVPRGDQLKSEELVNLVASPSASTAIGFVSSTLTGLAVAVPLAPGDGQPALRPDNFSVATEDYVLTRRLYLYNNSAISQDAQSFISFAAGREGQGVAKENHFVSLLAEAVWVPPPSNATPEFIDLTAGARRLSASFRFGSGSAELSPDRLAEDNIERVRSYVELNPGTELLVFGFADNRPPRRGPSNRKLSELRADVIASALEKQIGIPSSSIVVKGFGEEMPVDSNDTPIGRYRNRRVAIWVQQ
jgi:phosphate transport system substrate-binding protein